MFVNSLISYKCLNFIFLFCWMRFHCAHVSHVLYAFLCGWAPGWFHALANVSSVPINMDVSESFWYVDLNPLGVHQEQCSWVIWEPCLLLVPWWTSVLTSRVTAQFTFYQHHVSSPFLTLSAFAGIWVFSLLMIAILPVLRRNLKAVLICISLIANDVKCFSKAYWPFLLLLEIP